MRREQKLLLAFAAIVLIPVSIVWFVAWPLIHAWHLPVVVAGEMTEPGERVLTDSEAKNANLWLQSHTTGWGPVGERPPAMGKPPHKITPNVVLVMKSAEKEPLIVSLWRFDHGSDVMGIQTMVNGPFRMQSYKEADVTGLLPEDVRVR